MNCSHCNEPNIALCPQCAACFDCHDDALMRAVTEVNIAKEAAVKAIYGKQSEPRQRTLADRNIGSQWYPSDPNDTEHDDFKRTFNSIEKFLGFGGYDAMPSV